MQQQTDYQFLLTLKDLCFAYEELSVMKMQQIRHQVLSARDYYVKLSEVYYRVKFSYRQYVTTLEKKEMKKTHVKNIAPKSIVVLLSANTKLHGVIFDDVFTAFSNWLKHQESQPDIMITGKLGREFYQTMTNKPTENYFYAEIPDDNFTLDDLKLIVNKIHDYDSVVVFHGQYQSVVKQTPTTSNITGDIPLDPNRQVELEWFLFEPTLGQVLSFFQLNIFSALLKQTMHESQLARYASRITAMESAINRIDEEEHSLYNEIRRLKNQTDNKKQQERLAGMRMWRN